MPVALTPPGRTSAERRASLRGWIFDMILFGAFVWMAIANRRDPQAHKRWMQLATVNLVTAAIARWPGVFALGPLAFFGLTDLFIIAMAVWDFRTRGRLHPVTRFGEACSPSFRGRCTFWCRVPRAGWRLHGGRPGCLGSGRQRRASGRSRRQFERRLWHDLVHERIHG